MNRRNRAQYRLKEWKEFRANVIEMDGHQCRHCGRGKDEVVLQVHHEIYIKSRMPWEYGTEYCITLCKGCHAAEHGIIQPKRGWELIEIVDLKELAGTCQNGKCGQSIRYVYEVWHPSWGFLEVGTICCDYLTESYFASTHRKSIRRYESRKKRFIQSRRWKREGNIHRIKQSVFKVEIEDEMSAFYLTIHGLRSENLYGSLEEAKTKVFDVIESGVLFEYLDRNGIGYGRRKK
jgi:hypothetical protein